MYKIPVVRVCTSKRLTSFLFRFDFFEAFFPWGSMGTWRFASDDFPDAPEHHQFGHFSHRRSIHPRKYGFFLFHPKGFVYRYATCDTNLLTLQDIELHVVFFYFFLLDIIIYINWTTKKPDMSTTYVFCLETITFFFCPRSG